jgi:hypothetical protein
MGPLTIVDPLMFTKLVFALMKAPTSIPKNEYASFVALLIKPTDIFRVGCQLVVMLTVKTPGLHEPRKVTPSEVLPKNEPTEAE